MALIILAGMTGQALDAGSGEYEQRPDDRDALTRLHHLSTRFVREDLAAVLVEVVDAAIAITQADMGNIQLLDAATARLRIAAYRGHERWWMDYFESVGAGPGATCGTAMEQRARVVVEDVTTSPVFVGTPSLDIQLRAGVRAVQSTPLVDSTGRLVGMISTHFRRPHRPDEPTLRLIDLLARQTAEMVERTWTEEALRHSEERFRAFVQASSEVVYRVSADWSEMRQLVGRDFISDIEAPTATWLEKYVHPDDQASVRAALDAAIQTKSVFELEHRVLRADGTFGWTFSRAVPMLSSDGSIIEWFGTASDITARKTAEFAAETASALLREADHRKDEFLSVLSHELRNPLAPIRNSVALLRRAEPGSEPAKRALDVIDHQAAHMARLVDDLLDIGRITQGKVRLNKELVRMASVVRQTLDDHRALFRGRRIALEYHERAEPLWVEVDSSRLAQVVGNLLQNALKFTNQGGRVEVSLTDQGHRAILTVCDDGAGMDAATIARLFEPFMQADITLDRSQGGLGLGLALAKNLVEMQGGTIRASSPGLGKGSEFVVSLPVSREADAAPPTEARGSPRTRRRVLIVEDNADGAATLCDLLELEGHEVRVAHDGEQALNAAAAFSPDVVLCDLGLPGLSGYEVARRLRVCGSSTRLVALSGYATPEDVERARQAGFHDHLAKPPSIEKLFATVAADGLSE